MILLNVNVWHFFTLPSTSISKISTYGTGLRRYHPLIFTTLSKYSDDLNKANIVLIRNNG